MKRRLAAVLVADLVGSSRLMESDDARTYARIMALRRAVLDPALAAHYADPAKWTGDGIVAAFPSAHDGMACAVQVQTETARRETEDVTEQRLSFRMGLTVGDVMVDADDVHGMGVNIAARLQQMAEPGDLMISAAIRQQLGNLLPHRIVDLGEIELKNIAQPVHTFRVVLAVDRAAGRLPLARPTHMPSIAVMPFTNQLGDAAQNYLGDGMAEDITSSLAALKELMVISRNSTMGYRAADLDLRAVGRELGVQYVLSGWIRKGAGASRVTAELSDTDTGSIHWSEQFTLNQDSLFEVQDLITTEIVSAIAPHVQQAERRRMMLKRPDNMDAYDLVLQALELLYQLEPRSFTRCLALLQRAIALEPTYAMPYALLSEWHSLRLGQGWAPDRAAEGMEALRLAGEAVRHDPNNARALALLGHYKAYVDRDYDGAFALFDRAISACPNGAMGWGLSGPTHCYVGDGKGAMERAQRALRLSPRDPLRFFYYSTLAQAHMVTGDYEAAVQWGQAAIRDNPSYLAALRPLVVSMAALGRIPEAQAMARRMLVISPDFRVKASLQSSPYQDRAFRDWLGTYLIAAGLPE